MTIVLVSTYELGHQPFGLASPAAWLRRAGASVVCIDTAVQPLDNAALASATLVAFYLPMHTATRLAIGQITEVRQANPTAHICCYGLYAPMNEALLRSLGVQTILGGEFEAGLVALFQRLANGNDQPDEQPEPRISLARQQFVVPDRSELPTLSNYATLTQGNQQRVVGYTEASRGCKHLCRHCPIVPIYGGAFRVVQRDVVLADIRQQAAAGAEHITFGDPDFFNGPGHALPLVRALHAEFSQLTYDVTIKVEHLLRHADKLPVLRETGCVLVTSAVEAMDEQILTIFDKRHTRADFERAVALLRDADLNLNPTFVAFTPWTTRAVYLEFLRTIGELDLIENIAPIQYAIRLLIPAGSRLLELADVQQLVGEFDQDALCYRWQHPDPSMDTLQQALLRLVQSSTARSQPYDLFEQIWALASEPTPQVAKPHLRHRLQRPPIPYMSEPWYC